MRTSSVAVVLCLAVTAPAAGQTGDVFYRPGQPPVIEPVEQAERVERDSVLQRFQAAYRRAGSPRIVLFWNRTFDDRVSAWRPAVRTHGRDELGFSAHLRSERRPQEEGNGPTDHRIDGSARYDWSRQIDGFDPTPGVRGLGAADDAGLESGFVQTLSGGAARLIDRAAMLRILGDGGGSDLQVIEAAALRDHADLLVEMVRAPAPGVPLGSVFQIRVKELRTGRLLVSLSRDGVQALEQAEARYEAGENGFVRVARPSHELAEIIGERLALATMDALTAYWLR